MATLTPSAHAFDTRLLPQGDLWQPRASLGACWRAAMVRNTLGAVLSDAQRVNLFPASPLCSLSWWMQGSSWSLPWSPTGDFACDERSPMPGRWVLSGPQTAPRATWCPGPVHGLMVLFLPDALHHMTGLVPADLVNRFVDAGAVLPPDWLAMCEQVQTAPDDASRLQRLEDFLEPRWQAHRPTSALNAQRYTDWAAHLAQRAALSAPGRSLRQLERRVKRWTGLPMRELHGMGRSEQAFFATVEAHAEGDWSWAHIAADAGYADQSHLCRVTRRITGFSPEALRTGIQTQEPFWAYRLWM